MKIKKYLIISADDFGLTEGINLSVIDLFKEGVLTSTSVMANGSAFKNAMECLEKVSGLGVGVHLNILRGQPILPIDQVKSLVDHQGLFRGVHQNVVKLLLGDINLKEVKKEFRAQINKVLKQNVRVTHLDTEKHLHIFPSILKVIIELAVEFDINRIRFFRQGLNLFANGQCLEELILSCREKFLSSVSSTNYGYLSANNIKYPDFFNLVSSRLRKKQLLMVFQRVIHKIRSGVSEIICHPGYIHDGLRHCSREFRKFNIINHWDQTGLLMSYKTKEIIKASGVRLINYSQF